MPEDTDSNSPRSASSEQWDIIDTNNNLFLKNQNSSNRNTETALRKHGQGNNSDDTTDDDVATKYGYYGDSGYIRLCGSIVLLSLLVFVLG